MEIPHAQVKDLRSTGYFFEELKNYSQSPEMLITTYCNDFAAPYLVKLSESYDRSGRPVRSRILRLAIKHLSDQGEYEVKQFFKSNWINPSLWRFVRGWSRRNSL